MTKDMEKWNERVGERAQQVRILTAKPDDLSLILESTVEGKNHHACCLLTFTCVALPPQQIINRLSKQISEQKSICAINFKERGPWDGIETDAQRDTL